MVSKLTKVFGLGLHEDRRDVSRSPRKRRHLDSMNDVAADSLVTPQPKRVRFSANATHAPGDEVPVISRIASWVKMKATQFSSQYLVRPLPNGTEADENGPVDHSSRDERQQVPNRARHIPIHQERQNNGADDVRYWEPPPSGYARQPLHGPRHNGPKQHGSDIRKRTHRRHHDQTGNLQAPDLPVLEDKVENWRRMHLMVPTTNIASTDTLSVASSNSATAGSLSTRGGPSNTPAAPQSLVSRHRLKTPAARLQGVSTARPQGTSTVHDRLLNSTASYSSTSVTKVPVRSPECVRVRDRQDYKQLLEQYTSMNLDDFFPGRRSLLLDRTALHRTQLPREEEQTSATKTPNQSNKLPNRVPRSNSPITFDLTSRSSSASDLRSQPTISPPATVITSKPSKLAATKEVKVTAPCVYDSWLKEMKERFESSVRISRMKTAEKAAITTQYREKKELERQRAEAKVQEIIAGVKEHTIHDIESEFPAVEYDLEPEVVTVVDEEEEAEPAEPEEVFPELTEEMEAEVESALFGGQLNQELVSGFRIQLTRADIQTLDGLNWLNDEVMNFYFNLLADRSQKSDELPSVHTFNTFFYPKLVKDGYTSLRRWTKRVDVFTKDILLVPVHLGVHWCLAVIDFRSKCITYYDSMACINDKCLNALRDYLVSEHHDKKKSPYDVSDWELAHAKDIPLQMNGSDCGVFACKFAEYATRNKLPTFKQEHMPYFRRRMVWELLHKQLL